MGIGTSRPKRDYYYAQEQVYPVNGVYPVEGRRYHHHHHRHHHHGHHHASHHHHRPSGRHCHANYMTSYRQPAAVTYAQPAAVTYAHRPWF